MDLSFEERMGRLWSKNYLRFIGILKMEFQSTSKNKKV